jgi:LmbE family N-acetylglucosaminyl deacetylase
MCGSNILGVTAKMKSLILAPHVDDEVLGCGGILDKHCFVYYCGVDESEWNRKNRIVDRKHRPPVSQRIIELRKTAKLLGFRYEYNLNTVVNTYAVHDFINIFERLINKQKPDKMYIPSPTGYNQDHKAVFDAAFIALRPHDKNYFVKKVLIYENICDVTWSTKYLNLNYFVPIDVNRKIAAYRLQKSQVRAHRSPEMIHRIAKLRGDMSNCKYAEAFQILRWID